MNFDNVKKNLEACGYEVHCFATAAEAADAINRELDQTSVAFGGSKTADDMGLYEKLGTHNEVIWHWRVPEGKTANEIRKEAEKARVYISSVNGLSENGEIINIDGTGNRLEGTIYGHEKVIFVVGRNKIRPDFEKALYRARNVAGPLNAKRFGVKTPCVTGGHCYDCKSPQRICNALLVLWRAPKGSKYEVCLIDEDLGY